MFISGRQTRNSAQPTAAPSISTVTVVAPPTTMTAPATSATSPAPENKTQKLDDEYLRLFTAMSTLNVTDPVPIIALGKAQCDYLAQPGNTVASGTTVLEKQYHDLTRQQCYGIVSAAVTVYCPQYKGEL
jgi:hypothetical protein